MANQNTIKPILLTNIAASTFTGAYQAINTGLPHPCSLLYIINNSNKDVTVSFDGTNDHDYVPTMTVREIPAQAANQSNSKMALFSQGTIVYVKNAAAGTGNVYLSGYYTPTN